MARPRLNIAQVFRAGQRGIQLPVVYVPTMVRVMARYINFDRVEDQTSYLPERALDQEDFSGRIAELCGRIGCNFLDTSDALRQASANGNRSHYIPNDEHLDVGGHDVLAQIIADWLLHKDIVVQMTTSDPPKH